MFIYVYNNNNNTTTLALTYCYLSPQLTSSLSQISHGGRKVL